MPTHHAGKSLTASGIFLPPAVASHYNFEPCARAHKLMLELGSGDGELYDLQADPCELDNLFERAEHRALREHLQALLLARPGAIADIFPEPVGLA